MAKKKKYPDGGPIVPRPVAESTGIKKPLLKLSPQQLQANRDAIEKERQAILNQRKKAIDTSNSYQNKNPFSREAFQNTAIEDKMRIFPNDPHSLIDNYVNPLTFIGHLGDNLSYALSNPDASIGQKVASVGVPVALGALGELVPQLAKQITKKAPVPVEITEEMMQNSRFQVKEANDWLRDWYSHPLSRQRFEDAIALLPSESKSIGPTINLDKNLARQNASITARNNYSNLVDAGMDVVYPVDNAESIAGGSLGRYTNHTDFSTVSVNHPAFYDGSFYTPKTTAIHEGIHTITNGDNAFTARFSNKMKAAFNLGEGSKYERYLVEPTEAHARVGEIRHTFGLKPDTEVNDGYISDIIGAGKNGKTSVDPSFFNQIRDREAFKWIMNNAPAIAPVVGGAAIASQKNKPIMKNGGTISKKDKKNPLKAYFGSYMDAMQGSPSAIQGLSNADTPDLVGKSLNVQTLPLYNPSDIDVTKAVGPNNQITDIDQKSNIVPNQIRAQAQIDKKQMFGNQNTPQIDVKSMAGSILPFINALTNERDPARRAPFAPMEVYNPHPNGTGSQALYENGGPIAYNPNLSKKDKGFQKWYGANTLEGQRGVPFSENLDYDYYSFYRNKGEGNIEDHFPDTYKRPIHETFSNESIYSTPENPGGSWKGEKYIPAKKGKKAQMGMELEQFGDPVPYASTLTNSSQNMYNNVNALLSIGGNPMSSAEGKALLQSKESGNLKKTRALIDNIGIYNQRPDVMNMSPEQRVENYYQLASDNADVADYKQSYKNYGSGPTSSLWNSPSSNRKAPSSALAKQKNGGKNKAFWGAIAGVAGQAGGQIKDLVKKQTAAAAEAPQQIMQAFAQIANFKDTFHPTAGYQPGPYVQPDQMMYDNGGEIGMGNQITLHDEGSTQMLSYNPYDGGTMQLNGPSHEEGGIDMSYGGNRIEAEGQETGVKDAEGNLHIMGNMKVPGSNTKFKQVSKKIAEQEEKYEKLKTEGSSLVKLNDPEDKWQRFKFNAGTIMAQGGDMGQKDLAKKKNELSSLQSALLATAEEFNVSPEHLSNGEIKKAKKGTFAKAANGWVGDPVPKKASVAVRNNNPGNIKFGDFAKRHGAVQGDPATDGGYFAKFPDAETGLNAIRSLLQTKTYKNLPVDEAIKKWTNGTGYHADLSPFSGKSIKQLKDGELDNLVNTITYGEDGKYYTRNSGNIPSRGQLLTPTPTAPSPAPVQEPFSPYALPNTPFTYQNPIAPTPGIYTPPQQEILQPQAERALPSNAKGLSLGQILPELIAAGNNQLEPVNSQHYNPLLEQPYQVSFQDRMNANQSTFNALTRQINTTSPTALSTLSAQKYNADSSVLADEFRTNQAEANRVYNGNRNTLNDAQLKNLAIDDTQYTRQAQAKSNTKAQGQAILSSIAGKYLQNRLNNQRLAIGENFYNYRQDENGKLENYNPDAQFDFSGMDSGSNSAPYTRTRQIFDNNGQVKQSVATTPSAREQRLIDLKIQKQEIDKPKINISKLFKGLF